MWIRLLNFRCVLWLATTVLAPAFSMTGCIERCHGDYDDCGGFDDCEGCGDNYYHGYPADTHVDVVAIPVGTDSQGNSCSKESSDSESDTATCDCSLPKNTANDSAGDTAGDTASDTVSADDDSDTVRQYTDTEETWFDQYQCGEQKALLCDQTTCDAIMDYEDALMECEQSKPCGCAYLEACLIIQLQCLSRACSTTQIPDLAAMLDCAGDYALCINICN
ncbi:MAG: hypothetical protein JXR76_19135 [Deltaproteobacteria bacterium]|nr:hypothetical protein [Deltaproteobacteria bacterium]